MTAEMLQDPENCNDLIMDLDLALRDVESDEDWMHRIQQWQLENPFWEVEV